MPTIMAGGVALSCPSHVMEVLELVDCLCVSVTVLSYPYTHAIHTQILTTKILPDPEEEMSFPIILPSCHLQTIEKN